MALVSFPLYYLNVHWVSCSSLSVGLSLVTARAPRPEFANIMFDIGRVQISLLIAYSNFGPAQWFITANIISKVLMGSAASSRYLLWSQTCARCLRNHKISLSSRSAACPNNHPSSRRPGLATRHLCPHDFRTTGSRSRLVQCKTATSCRGHPCQSRSRLVSYVLVRSLGWARSDTAAAA